VLAQLGFGLDLSECAATGAREDLVYVSPRTGRAVSAQAGAPYADRLLPLPPFLRPDGESESAPPRADVLAGFALVGRFFARDVLTPRGRDEPEARRAYLARLAALES